MNLKYKKRGNKPTQLHKRFYFLPFAQSYMIQNYDQNYDFYKVNTDQYHNSLHVVSQIPNFQQYDTLYIDLSASCQHNEESIITMFKEIPYKSLHFIRVQILLCKGSKELRFSPLISKMRCIEQVDIKCVDENSVGLAFLVLETISHINVKKLAFNIQTVNMEQPAYHVKIAKALQRMEELENLTLYFNEYEQMPSSKPLYKLDSVKHLKIKGGRRIYDYYINLFPNLESLQLKPDKIQFKQSNNLVNNLVNLQELTIQSINLMRFNNLINLKKLTITEKFTGFTYFDDFRYLQNLNKLIILPQLDQNDINWLNQIPFFPKGCLLEIKTLYYSKILSLGQNTDIFLKITQSDLCANGNPQIAQSYQNWGGIRYLQNLISLEQNICHGERFSDYEIIKFIDNLSQCEQLIFLRLKFFSQQLRKPCQIPKRIEQDLALNTDIMFFETDVKFSKQYQQFLNQKQATFLFLLISKKYIQNNSSIYYQDLIS